MLTAARRERTLGKVVRGIICCHEFPSVLGHGTREVIKCGVIETHAAGSLSLSVGMSLGTGWLTKASGTKRKRTKKKTKAGEIKTWLFASGLVLLLDLIKKSSPPPRAFVVT